MKIVFISNFITDHQKYLSLEFDRMDDVDYAFIETITPDDSFQSENLKNEPKMSFVIGVEEFKNNRERYQKIIDDADVVIHGSAPDELIVKRINDGKLTFKYSERFYKDGFRKSKYIRNYLAAWLHHGRFMKKRIYMLATSAFTPDDCKRFDNYIDKCYKWGYFPKFEVLDIEKTVALKRKASIVWAGRFIDWKHPELPIMVAKRLKADGYDFSLTMFGKGEMFEEISELIKAENLQDNVFLDDSKNSEQLREIMKSSSIFLHTANRKEGWGVVINEAMNSGCAVVASHIVGSVPYLIKDNENGMIFEDGNIENLYKKVKFLLDNPEKCGDLGKNAYNTVANLWNPQIAAERFYALAKALLSGDDYPELFESGPCSKAEIIKDNWYKSDWN